MDTETGDASYIKGYENHNYYHTDNDESFFESKFNAILIRLT
jgi:hypothetical protein